MKDLETVLKTLQANKSRDPEGIDRSIFGMNTVGNDLKLSLLILFNNMKTRGIVPEFMRKATVTTIPKKGSKLLLKNERGIFIVNSVRNILMRLIYNMNQPILEHNMSDSNVGGRKGQSGINHIWTIKRIIHEHISSVRKKTFGLTTI